MITEVLVPKLGSRVLRGILVCWSKREGEPIEEGEALAEVETDKITLAVEAPAAGVLEKIYVREEENFELLKAICAIRAKD